MERTESHVRNTSTGPVAHSTPTKMDRKSVKYQTFASREINAADCGSPAITRRYTRSPTRVSLNEMERETIVKQRTELQLMISELRDRDRELNDMANSHHQQMQCWEEDRKRLMALELKSSKLERDLTKRTNQIKELLKKLKSIETEALNSSSALESTRNQLSSITEEHCQMSSRVNDMEELNASLKKSVRDLSRSLGESETQTHELNSLLSKKDKDAMETSKELMDLSARLQSLEFSYQQLEKITFDVRNSASEWKNKYSDAKQEIDKLRRDISARDEALDDKELELQKSIKAFKEQQEELSYTVEREKRKDQLIELQRSKQERLDGELTTLRQMYELQQHKLEASRKELLEVKDKSLQHASICDESIIAWDSNMAPRKISSPFTSPPRSPLKHGKSPEAARTDNKMGHSSTERLQRLLNDSKELVASLTNSET